MVVFLFGLRVVIQKLMRRYFMMDVPQPTNSDMSLEFSYLYHLSIIILILSDVNWNLFDLVIWLFSYVCIGMLRKAVYVAETQK